MNTFTKFGVAVAATCGMLAATAANAVVILGNYDGTVGQQHGSFAQSGISPAQHKGVTFTTTEDYLLDSLFLALGNINANDDEAIAIRETDINGAVVTTFTTIAPTPGAANGNFTYELTTGTPFVLTAGSYALDLREATNLYNWLVVLATDPANGDFSPLNVTPTGAASFDGYEFEEFGSGNGVVGSTTFNNFRLEGTVVAAVPVPGSILLLGLPLIYIVRRRKV